MEKILRLGRKIIPSKIFKALQPIYHWKLAFLAALIYGFPSRRLDVIAITGTKGKSSTAELVNSILETAGHKTALLGTIRFKIAGHSEPNMHKMTVPGRFFVQKFLRNAVDAKCDYAILEMTSEAARQYRHKFISLDALIFLNLSPEHIESHGSYEKYVKAKLSLAEALERSTKKRKVLIVNAEDREAPKFLGIEVKEKYPFSTKMAEPYTLTSEGTTFHFHGQRINSPLLGLFNIANSLAAATYALTQNIPLEKIKEGLEQVVEIKGRVQKIVGDPKQDFTVVVDYAHTADSLTKLYETFPIVRKICVLGNTGGGRDKWKRVEMAKVAETHCDSIILTNEDPYDDDPLEIIEDMARGIEHKPKKVILDRREAIRQALSEARTGDVVLISGKGTDPYIMEANGKKTPWSDARVTTEEIKKKYARAS